MYWKYPVNNCYMKYPRPMEVEEDWQRRVYKKWHKDIKDILSEEEDDDGFRVIPPLPIAPPKKKTGIKCGLCGAKFEDGKPVLYSCSDRRCPIFRQITY